MLSAELHLVDQLCKWYQLNINICSLFLHLGLPFQVHASAMLAVWTSSPGGHVELSDAVPCMFAQCSIAVGIGAPQRAVTWCYTLPAAHALLQL